jgi:DNA-binding transcriptional ArsR family regulator
MVIDRLREQLQDRLDQLLSEADRLRKALAALGPRSSTKTPTQKSAARGTAPATGSTPQATTAAKRTPARGTAKPAARSPRRTAPGATKAAVLAALDGSQGMTAGEVAAKAGLGRGTVSTTLSKLTKSGEVEKAERGYRLPSPARTPSSPAGT